MQHLDRELRMFEARDFETRDLVETQIFGQQDRA